LKNAIGEFFHPHGLYHLGKRSTLQLPAKWDIISPDAEPWEENLSVILDGDNGRWPVVGGQRFEPTVLVEAASHQTLAAEH
jgi:hypothetical protein